MTKFRIQYKCIGLTYSRCPLTRQEVLTALKAKLPLEEWYIAQETHKENDAKCPTHIHAWIKLMSKPNIGNSRYFDIGEYHPNIGKYNRSWVHNYLKKQDKEPLTNIPDGFIDIARSGDYKAAIKRFSQLHPMQYAINKSRVDDNLRAMARKAVVHPVYPDPKEMGFIWDTSRSPHRS